MTGGAPPNDLLQRRPSAGLCNPIEASPAARVSWARGPKHLLRAEAVERGLHVSIGPQSKRLLVLGPRTRLVAALLLNEPQVVEQRSSRLRARRIHLDPFFAGGLRLRKASRL